MPTATGQSPDLVRRVPRRIAKVQVRHQLHTHRLLTAAQAHAPAVETATRRIPPRYASSGFIARLSADYL